MKKIIIAGLFFLGGCVFVHGAEPRPRMPAHVSKFKGMIIRFDPATLMGRWECEFGVETATATVEDNLIFQSVGCKPDPNISNGIKVSSGTIKMEYLPWNNLNNQIMLNNNY